MDWFKVVFFLSGLTLCFSKDIVMTPSGKDMVTVGSTLKIRCEHAAGVKMSHNSVDFDDSDFSSKSQTTIKGVQNFVVEYTIQSVTKGNAGNYECYQKGDKSIKQELQVSVVEITSENGVWDGTAYQSATMKCKIDDASSKSTVKWMKDGKELTEERFNITGASVTVKSIRKADVGEYNCVYTFAEENKGSVEGKAFLESSPLIEKLPESKNLVQDETLNISCKIYGYPVPSVSWSKEGQDIKSDKRVKFEESHGVPNATLIITSLENDDRAEYSCTAVNTYGNKTQTFLLRVKGKYAALWPFIGIVIEVLVVCAIIFIYEKKRARPESDDSDALNAKANDEKPAADVRQRNVKA